MTRAAFFDAIRANPFGGSLSQSAVDGIEAIVAAWQAWGDGDERKLAYILSSAFHESDRFRAMEEYASGAAYEGRADLGNTQPGDGKRFKGRGFVQITGRRNYTDWSDRLDINLLFDPARAAERDIAARILVEGMMLGTFTGKRLGKYVDGGNADFINARRVVNGTDRARDIAEYAEAFLAALIKSNPPTTGSGVQAPQSPAQPPEPPPAPLGVEERLRSLANALDDLAGRVAKIEAEGGARSRI